VSQIKVCFLSGAVSAGVAYLDHPHFGDLISSYFLGPLPRLPARSAPKCQADRSLRGSIPGIATSLPEVLHARVLQSLPSAGFILVLDRCQQSSVRGPSRMALQHQTDVQQGLKCYSGVSASNTYWNVLHSMYSSYFYCLLLIFSRPRSTIHYSVFPSCREGPTFNK
jgi:hypothetical protein